MAKYYWIKIIPVCIKVNILNCQHIWPREYLHQYTGQDAVENSNFTTTSESVADSILQKQDYSM